MQGRSFDHEPCPSEQIPYCRAKHMEQGGTLVAAIVGDHEDGGEPVRGRYGFSARKPITKQSSVRVCVYWEQKHTRSKSTAAVVSVGRQDVRPNTTTYTA